MKTESTESLSIKRANFVDKYLPPGDEQRYYQRLEMHEELFDLTTSHSPKIKQLEWKEYENFRGRKSYFAKTPFSPYEVADGGDHYTMFSPNKRLRFASADEAKAAAQADFEKRVKECLL